MSRTVSIEPVTRIEGHLKVETKVDNGRVSDAFVSGQMYRGFEKFLEGRHPVDAARIAQRVCGVCHEVHGIASTMALEKLYKNPAPRNGHILRDMILGLHLITDHFLHFYTLSVPDYVDFTQLLSYQGRDTDLLNLKRWVAQSRPQFVLKRTRGNYLTNTSTAINICANYFKALKIRSEGAAGIAIIGAKAPFAHAILPGGITTDITPDTLLYYQKVLDDVKNFTFNNYIPDVMAVAGHFHEYFNMGSSYNNFYAHRTFNALGHALFKGGILINGHKTPFNFSKIKEHYDTSFYDADGYPNPDKKGAYSWIKAPRYDGEPLETGPLARMIVCGNGYFHKLMGQLNAPVRSSAMARHVARAAEVNTILAHMYALLDAYRFGEPNIHQIDFSKKVSGRGIGFSIAARGALIHDIQASNGKITRYNMVVPSTWNFSPTSGGKKGVVERALIGTPVSGSGEDSIEVGRIVRSYDPCTACSVH